MERRQLRFTDFEQVIRDAEHLLAVGYDRAGKWDLSQVCNHLTEWARYPLDGFPKLPWWLKPIFAIVKVTMLPKLERQMREEKKMPAGMGTAPMTVFPPSDPQEAVANLAKQLRRYAGHTEPMHPSPLRGLLSKEDWIDSQLVHCAHHLSFLVPKAAAV